MEPNTRHARNANKYQVQSCSPAWKLIIQAKSTCSLRQRKIPGETQGWKRCPTSTHMTLPQLPHKLPLSSAWSFLMRRLIKSLNLIKIWENCDSKSFAIALSRDHLTFPSHAMSTILWRSLTFHVWLNSICALLRVCKGLFLFSP